MNEKFLLSLCTIGGKNLPQCEKELQNFPSLSVKRKRNNYKWMNRVISSSCCINQPK